MADFPIMPLCTDAYLADTMHLSIDEHGAYLKLLMIMWRTSDGWLDDDDKRLAMMLGVTVARWRKLWTTLNVFFTLEDGRLTQKKLQKMRENVSEKSSQASRAAKAKWLKYNKTKSADASATKTKTKTKEEEEPAKAVSKKASPAESDFPDWYTLYPLHKGRKAALKAYLLARKEVSAADLLAGAQRYASAMTGTEPRFIAHPATWLNQGRWNDEYPVSDATKPAGRKPSAQESQHAAFARAAGFGDAGGDGGVHDTGMAGTGEGGRPDQDDGGGSVGQLRIVSSGGGP